MGVTFNDVDDEDDFGETHEINVTPFIDVMLVLLIIFMVAAPLSTVDLPVDLPSRANAAEEARQADLCDHQVRPRGCDRRDAGQTRRSRPHARSGRFRQGAAHSPACRPTVSYGEMMYMLELLRIGGYTKVALVALEGRPDFPGQPIPPSLGLAMNRRLRFRSIPRRAGALWVAAATIAVSLPSGFAALAYVHLQQDAESDDLGAPGIEIDFASPRPERCLPICLPVPRARHRSRRPRSRSKWPRSRKPTCRRTCRSKPRIPIGR